MRRRRAVATAAGTWLAPAGVLIGGLALVLAMLRPAGGRGLIEGGVAYAISAYDLVLPLVGLGVALTTVALRYVILCAMLLVAGAAVGVLGEHRLLATATLAPELARYFICLGALCCLVAGLTLAPAGRLRLWLAPGATALTGAALGFLAALHDPAAGDPPASLDPGAAAPPPAFEQPREWGDESRQP